MISNRNFRFHTCHQIHDHTVGITKWPEMAVTEIGNVTYKLCKFFLLKMDHFVIREDHVISNRWKNYKMALYIYQIQPRMGHVAFFRVIVKNEGWYGDIKPLFPNYRFFPWIRHCGNFSTHFRKFDYSGTSQAIYENFSRKILGSSDILTFSIKIKHFYNSLAL